MFGLALMNFSVSMMMVAVTAVRLATAALHAAVVVKVTERSLAPPLVVPESTAATTPATLSRNTTPAASSACNKSMWVQDDLMRQRTLRAAGRHCAATGSGHMFL